MPDYPEKNWIYSTFSDKIFYVYILSKRKSEKKLTAVAKRENRKHEGFLITGKYI